METRRQFFQKTLCRASAVALLPHSLQALASPSGESAAKGDFQLNYMLASCMYGELDLQTVLDAAVQTGAGWVDLWPRVHGSQREQLDEWGLEKFEAALKERGLRLGCLTRYDLGPFRLGSEIELAGRLRCPLIVTGGKGPVGLTGQELKSAVRDFIDKLKPYTDAAAESGVTISIENHGNNLIHAPDSLLWLKELAPENGLGCALAPYHLETLGLGAEALAQLIKDLGNFNRIFYAWQYGKGCMKKLSKEEELLQMPGRGDLDFSPLVKAMRDVGFDGWTELFMHPVPRGIPILPTAEATTGEILRSKAYMDQLVTTQKG